MFRRVAAASRISVTAGPACVLLVSLTAASATTVRPTAHGTVVGADAPAKSGGTAVARVHGSGRIAYAYAPDDRIRFTVDATAAPFSRPAPAGKEPRHGLPTDARGTLRWSHRVAATGETLASEAAVDCLVTGDGVATFTAVVTKVNDPRLEDTLGQRLGFGVLDGSAGAHGDRGGRDRFGFS
ncbi:hypothetical protein [Streptomyces sp. NPDC047108]|uniref:hypothetical protein n=1 Tax=Streptomyces sp. NPDC047108 TaxID=3155025 RepID=UPI0033C189AB